MRAEALFHSPRADADRPEDRSVPFCPERQGRILRCVRCVGSVNECGRKRFSDPPGVGFVPESGIGVERFEDGAHLERQVFGQARGDELAVDRHGLVLVSAAGLLDLGADATETGDVHAFD